jgi:hypothetical protein
MLQHSALRRLRLCLFSSKDNPEASLTEVWDFDFLFHNDFEIHMGIQWRGLDTTPCPVLSATEPILVLGKFLTHFGRYRGASFEPPTPIKSLC